MSGDVVESLDGDTGGTGSTSKSVTSSRSPFPWGAAVRAAHQQLARDVSKGDEHGSAQHTEAARRRLSRHLGTINWEIVCGFGPRLPRRYVG